MDLFERKQSVSLVAFTMKKIRPRYLPAFTSISNFDENNIRACVKANKKSAVWILSIEGGKKFSSTLAKHCENLQIAFQKSRE